MYTQDILDFLYDIIKTEIQDSSICLSLESNLRVIGIDSLLFIKLLVKIEDKYEIEFDDRELNYDNSESIKNLAELIGRNIINATIQA